VPFAVLGPAALQALDFAAIEAAYLASASTTSSSSPASSAVLAPVSISALKEAWTVRKTAEDALRAAILEAENDCGMDLEVLKDALVKGREAGLEGEVNSQVFENC
jgi:hypothetical protein